MSTFDTSAGVRAHPATRNHRAHARRSVLPWVGQVAAFTLILSVGAALAAAVLVPRLAGGTPYTILTSSMTPQMPPGTLVVVRPRPVEQIGIGNVITYQLESGKPTVVTHRVVAVASNTLGELTFRTKGDANDTVDAAPVRPVQVRGVYWYRVPLLGYANTVITAAERRLALDVVVVCLLGYAGYMFVAEARHRRGRSRAVA